MVLNRTFTRNRLVLYLIPIMIGIGGIVFSLQLNDLFLRVLVIVLSVSVPLYAGGHILARYKTRLRERLFLGMGILMLVVGASVSVSGFTPIGGADGLSFFHSLDIPGIIGFSSLTLGLFVVLYAVGRAGEDIEDIGLRFQHLAEHMNEGFVLTSADGDIMMVNEQFLRMCGLPENKVIGANALDLANRLDLPPVTNHLQYRAKGIASEYEVTWRVRGEERRYWFHGKPLHDAQGRVQGVLATVRDITEQHRLTQQVEAYALELQDQVDEQTARLRQSETRQRQLLLSMNEGFLTIDEDHRIRFVNARFAQMMGLPESAVLNRDIFDFVDATSRIRLANMLVRDADAATRREISFVDNAGTPLPTLTASAYLSDFSERTPRFSLVVTNVRELKEMQRQLEDRATEMERVNEELRMHDRAKDAFLSNVSHELRTPLSTIQGYIEMLNSGTLGPLDDAQENALRIMNRNGQRLLGLINEIIDFSRMEIRGVQLNHSLFSPQKLVEEAVASAKPDALAREIDVTWKGTDEQLYAWGDWEKLGQVLTILLNNALKFTVQGGHVTVHVSVSPGDTLHIAVTDTGIGIEPAFQQKVFEKFFQVDSSKSRRYEGAGIGLSIAKSIVEAHGGRIALQSAPGTGTTFILSFPSSLVGAAAGDFPADAEKTAVSMVLIDESPLLGEALEPVVEQLGWCLQRVPHMNGALRAIREENVNVAILNAQPDDPVGEGARRILRGDPAVAAMPLLICTSESFDKLHGVETHANVQFLPKPFSLRTLLACVLESVRGDEGQSDDSLRAIRALSPPGHHVLVVDSDPGILEWMELALSRQGIVCSCATTPEAALKSNRNEIVSAVFVDIDIPGRDLVDYLRSFQENPSTRESPLFVMSGVRDEIPDGISARGLLQKPFAIAELIDALPEELHGSKRPVSPVLL